MDHGPDDRLEPDVKEPLSEQLAGILRARILRGDWKPGRRVASEVRLATEYGTSRPTARKAFVILETAGYVETVPSSGTYVADPLPEADDQGDEATS